MNVVQIQSASPPVKHVRGRTLARRLRGMTPAEKALAAYEATTGGVVIQELSRRQAARLFGASYGYVAAVGDLTPNERDHLRNGAVSLLSEAHRRRSRSQTDAAFERFVATIGINRAWSLFERLTDTSETPNC